MAVLKLLHYPDPQLRTKASPVVAVDERLRQFVEDMYETMYYHRGVGLAATQVGVHQRIFVMDVSSARDQKICIINPEIVKCEGAQYEQEGCLSVVGAYDKVERAAKVWLRGKDLDMQTIELTAEGLMAVCIQHEIDHLNGTLFIDHLSRLKQARLQKKVEKERRREQL